MAGAVTINAGGAGLVFPTITDGTSNYVATQAAAIIAGAVASSNTTIATITPSAQTAPAVTPGTTGILVVNTTDQSTGQSFPVNIAYPAGYSDVIVANSPAPVTISGGGSGASQQIVLGSGAMVANLAGGSGTVVGGDGNKTINVGAGTNFAVYTGGGNDTISLQSTLASGQNTVSAGTGQNVIRLGAAPTQVRSTGQDSIAAGAGPATIQAVGNVQDTVTAGPSKTTFVNSTAPSTVDYSMTTTQPSSTGSTTVVGGAGGGYYKGGSSGSNLLVGGLGAVTLQGAGSGDVLLAMGNTGTQVLQAGAGNETLLGSLSTTSNVFVAGSGADLIVAGIGADTLYAGAGSATMTGGAGFDTFIFNPARSAGGQVTITDFTPGQDRITLQNYASGAAASALASATLVSSNASRVTLSDGTTITFQGITSVKSTFFT